jgi:pyridoxamine 5'-phosphate oxidase
MSDRSGIFAGEDPFAIARTWLKEAESSEINDPDAIALSTVDADGLPNARMVLLKEIEPDAFVFYTNYEGRKAGEIEAAGNNGNQRAAQAVETFRNGERWPCTINAR